MLSTKAGHLVRQGYDSAPATVFDYNSDSAPRSHEQGLAHLGRDQFDMLILRDASRRSHGDSADAVFRQALASALCEEMRSEGLVADYVC